MRCVHRLRKLRFLSSSFRRCMLSLLTGPAESSRGALRHSGFDLSASTPWLHPYRLPPRLTSRSSRRRVVASLKLLGMRAILAPNRRVRRGLTQALGGKEHSVVALSALQLACFGQHCSSEGSWARRFFGQVCYPRSHVACVALPGFGSYVCFRLVTELQMQSLMTGPADSSRGALRRPGFGFRQVRHSFTLAGIRPA